MTADPDDLRGPTSRSDWSVERRTVRLVDVVRLSSISILVLLTGLLAALPGAGVRAGDADAQEPDADHIAVTQLVAAGWQFLDAGSLGKAEQAFTDALEKRAGRDRAEVYYALSAVWWERRNAMASYSWLREAQEAQRNSWYWDGGDEETWDRRISGRLRYIERNFTVVKLRSPGQGRPLPPLADPPPADPLLRRFYDRLSLLV